ncbi:EndoU domain-containing protein [Paenibacillus sp. FSL H8-0283]|uniref:EndoU domain-containing protein n=1 Tax=Paenibacillus sp. FSL H8-0283 TaxID=2921383 RepID=UPI00325027A1
MNKITFNIIKEYANGVRVGNIPNHKNKVKRSGEGQAWFPKEWTSEDIKKSGEHIANLPENRVKGDGEWMFGNYNDVRVGVIKNDGQIGTITPDNSRQP